MRAAGDDPALVQDHDLVAVEHGGQPVGDDEQRPVGRGGGQPLDRPAGVVVEPDGVADGEGGGQPLSLDDVAAEQGTGSSIGSSPVSWDDASHAVDDIRRRFGDDAIGPARLARPGAGLRLTRRGQRQWGPEGPEG